MKFGICCGPAVLARDNEPLKDSVARLMEALKDAGAEYVEFPVASVAPEEDKSTFNDLLEAMKGAPLRMEAMNGFIPGHHRITGVDIDVPKVLSYCDEALSRAHELGVQIVVLGSGGARKVADDFDHHKALEQFIEFCRQLGPIAQKHHIHIAIEPLNTHEDNLINTVAQGAQVVESVNHPYIQLLADFYHMFVDDEPLGNIIDSGKYIVHTHLADTGRITAGIADPEADFRGFFKALRASGFSSHPEARCSFEGHIESIPEQAKNMFTFLNQRWKESEQ
ncbi:MAG: sugar phosphate isomerase/epimerase family protein [Abditibacteriaceae bacterium]